MKNENLQISFAPGCEKAEVVIREVNSVNELPVKPPVKISISGVIGAPFEFLLRRRSESEQIDEKRCHVIVDRDEISIQLVTNEHDEYNKGSVTGKLEFNPKFEEFGINNGKKWAPLELGMFFKMNRAFFTTKEDNMKLVTDLMNFTATVNNSIERSAKESGDRSDKFEQVVSSNLPKSFNLNIPIFKGMPSETIEVETFASINGREVAFILLSPGAQATMEDLRNKVIDEQIDKIREVCPSIAIIEK